MSFLVNYGWTLVARFTAPGAEWLESMDIVASDTVLAPVPSLSAGICNAFFELERLVHRGSSTFLETQQIYPKRLGNGPLISGFYEPIEELTVHTPCIGDTTFSAAVVGDMEDLQVVGYVRKHCAGKDGKLYHRLMFREGDVKTTSDGGFWTWTFATGGGYPNPPTYAGVIATSGMNHYMTGGSSITPYYFGVFHYKALGDVGSERVAMVQSMSLEYPGLRERRRR